MWEAGSPLNELWHTKGGFGNPRQRSGFLVSLSQKFGVDAAGVTDHVAVGHVVASPSADWAFVDPNETEVAIVLVNLRGVEADDLVS